MKRLQTCCCCASTRTGTLIIAGLGIVCAIITIITLWLVPNHILSFGGFGLDEQFEKDLSKSPIPRIILTINLIFTILICTLLIIAVKKRRSWMMLPWVVLGIVLAIGLLISVLHTSITLYLEKDKSNDDHKVHEDNTLTATMVLIGGIIYLCVYLYLWAVVFSYYLNVRDEEERGRYSKTPYRR